MASVMVEGRVEVGVVVEVVVVVGVEVDVMVEVGVEVEVMVGVGVRDEVRVEVEVVGGVEMMNHKDQIRWGLISLLLLFLTAIAGLVIDTAQGFPEFRIVNSRTVE